MDWLVASEKPFYVLAVCLFLIFSLFSRVTRVVTWARDTNCRWESIKGVAIEIGNMELSGLF